MPQETPTSQIQTGSRPALDRIMAEPISDAEKYLQIAELYMSLATEAVQREAKHKTQGKDIAKRYHAARLTIREEWSHVQSIRNAGGLK